MSVVLVVCGGGAAAGMSTDEKLFLELKRICLSSDGCIGESIVEGESCKRIHAYMQTCHVIYVHIVRHTRNVMLIDVKLMI